MRNETDDGNITQFYLNIEYLQINQITIKFILEQINITIIVIVDLPSHQCTNQLLKSN